MRSARPVAALVATGRRPGGLAATIQERWCKAILAGGTEKVAASNTFTLSTCRWLGLVRLPPAVPDES